MLDPSLPQASDSLNASTLATEIDVDFLNKAPPASCPNYEQSQFASGDPPTSNNEVPNSDPSILNFDDFVWNMGSPVDTQYQEKTSHVGSGLLPVDHAASLNLSDQFFVGNPYGSSSYWLDPPSLVSPHLEYLPYEHGRVTDTWTPSPWLETDNLSCSKNPDDYHERSLIRGQIEHSDRSDPCYERVSQECNHSLQPSNSNLWSSNISEQQDSEIHRQAFGWISQETEIVAPSTLHSYPSDWMNFGDRHLLENIGMFTDVDETMPLDRRPIKHERSWTQDFQIPSHQRYSCPYYISPPFGGDHSLASTSKSLYRLRQHIERCHGTSQASKSAMDSSRTRINDYKATAQYVLLLPFVT
jgi:hypothetical protein